MPSPEKSCMKCVAARWGRCARGRSRHITAAARRDVPFAQYYGSVDATPLFVLLAGLYVERTGDDETLRELWPAIEAALRWIDGPGDPDGDGLIETPRP